MEPVIHGSESVCIEISFVSSDFGEANKRTRKNRGECHSYRQEASESAIFGSSFEFGAWRTSVVGPIIPVAIRSP